MAAGYETPTDTRGDTNILGNSIGTAVSKVLAAKVMANKEREYAKKQASKQGIDEAQFDAMNPPGFFFKKALVGEFGGFAVKKKKQELAALYRKGLMLGKITKNKRLRGKVIGQLKESLIYSKANLKNAKRFRSQFDYNDYDEIFAPQNKKIPSTRKKVQNALGGGKGKRISREQIIESIDAIAKSIEKTAQSITQSSASVYGTLIVSNQLQADVAKDLKIRNSTLEDKLQKLVDVISNQTQIHQDFIDKKEDIQQESQLERKTVAAASEIPDDLKTIVNESRTYSTFANEQAMMDPFLRQPPEVKPVNSMVNDTASMEAYGFPKAERGGKFTGNGPLELHGTEALASDSGVKIVSGPDSGYIHKIDEPTSIIPLDNNFTQGERSAVDGKVRPKPKKSIINNKFNNAQSFELGTTNILPQKTSSTFNSTTQMLVDAMRLPEIAAGGGILAKTTEYINAMGSSGDDFKPEITKISRGIASGFNLPSSIVTKASKTKLSKKQKDQSKDKKDVNGSRKSFFEKLKEGFGKLLEKLNGKVDEVAPANPPPSPGQEIDYSNLKAGDISTTAGKVATLYDEMRNVGFTPEASKRLISEIGREGGMQNRNLFGTHENPGNPMLNTGMISWNKDRRDKLIAEAKKAGVWDENKGQLKETAESLRFQVRFLRNEMAMGPSKYQEVLKLMTAVGTNPAAISKALKEDFIVYRTDQGYSGGPDPEFGSVKNKEWYNRLKLNQDLESTRTSSNASNDLGQNIKNSFGMKPHDRFYFTHNNQQYNAYKTTKGFDFYEGSRKVIDPTEQQGVINSFTKARENLISPPQKSPDENLQSSKSKPAASIAMINTSSPQPSTKVVTPPEFKIAKGENPLNNSGLYLG